MSGLGEIYCCGAASDLAERATSLATAMKKRDVKLREWRPVHLFGFAVIGVMFIAMGALSLLRGQTHYENYWGGAVFAPFAVFVGFLFLVGVFTHWRKGR